MIGREWELAEIASRLSANRLVTLSGPGEYADHDAIVAMLTRRELHENRPNGDFMGTPGFGSDTVGSRLYLGGDSFFTIPAGSCDFSSWQITRQEFR